MQSKWKRICETDNDGIADTLPEHFLRYSRNTNYYHGIVTKESFNSKGFKKIVVINGYMGGAYRSDINLVNKNTMDYTEEVNSSNPIFVKGISNTYSRSFTITELDISDVPIGDYYISMNTNLNRNIDFIYVWVE